MPNSSTAFGFLRYQSGAGAGATFNITRRRILSTNATAIYAGDPVMPTISTANGYITQGAAGTTVLHGVFLSCQYFSIANGRTVWRNYWPGSDASGDVLAYVVDDPQARFRVMGVSTTYNITGTLSAWTSSPIGQYAQFAIGAGTVVGGYGKSGAYLDTKGTTVTLPFIVIDLIVDPPGDNGTDPLSANNHVVVGFNNEWMRDNGAGPTGIS